MKRTPRTLFLAVVVVAAACATQKPATQKPSTPQKAAAAPAAPAAAAPPAPASDVTEAGLRTDAGQGVFELRDDLKNVQFEFDRANLTPESQAILKADADVIKANSGLVILVAGHCDERGTVAYNLALGQKRAKAVRDYYRMLGVDGKRVATISYGKEKPLCTESTEDCWARNRRAETRARPKAGSAGAPASAAK